MDTDGDGAVQYDEFDRTFSGLATSGTVSRDTLEPTAVLSPEKRQAERTRAQEAKEQQQRDKQAAIARQKQLERERLEREEAARLAEEERARQEKEAAEKLRLQEELEKQQEIEQLALERKHRLEREQQQREEERRRQEEAERTRQEQIFRERQEMVRKRQEARSRVSPAVVHQGAHRNPRAAVPRSSALEALLLRDFHGVAEMPPQPALSSLPPRTAPALPPRTAPAPSIPAPAPLKPDEVVPGPTQAFLDLQAASRLDAQIRAPIVGPASSRGAVPLPPRMSPAVEQRSTPTVIPQRPMTYEDKVARAEGTLRKTAAFSPFANDREVAEQLRDLMAAAGATVTPQVCFLAYLKEGKDVEAAATWLARVGSDAAAAHFESAGLRDEVLWAHQTSVSALRGTCKMKGFSISSYRGLTDTLDHFLLLVSKSSKVKALSNGASARATVTTPRTQKAGYGGSRPARRPY